MNFIMAFDNEPGDPAFRPGAHLSVNYFLDTTDRVSRWLGRDVVDSIVFLGIMAGNFANPPAGDPDETDTLTDGRTPVSITALSRVLDMPYETVRRHAQALRAAGYCSKQKGGYVVPSQVANRLDLEELHTGMTQATLQLLDNLARIGVPVPAASSPSRENLGRQSARMAISYYVEGMAGLCRVLKMDAIRAVILLNIVRRNHAAFEQGLGSDLLSGAPARWFTDPMRKAVSTYCVAKTLRLPYETVRRHCRALLEQGAVESDQKGQLLFSGRLLNTQMGLAAAWSAWVATRGFMDSLAKAAGGRAMTAFA